MCRSRISRSWKGCCARRRHLSKYTSTKAQITAFWPIRDLTISWTPQSLPGQGPLSFYTNIWIKKVTCFSYRCHRRRSPSSENCRELRGIAENCGELWRITNEKDPCLSLCARRADPLKR